jgi:hypothetical protein
LFVFQALLNYEEKNKKTESMACNLYVYVSIQRSKCTLNKRFNWLATNNDATSPPNHIALFACSREIRRQAGKTGFSLYYQFESTNLQLPEKFVSRFPRSLPDIPLIGIDTASANRR